MATLSTSAQESQRRRALAATLDAEQLAGRVAGPWCIAILTWAYGLGIWAPEAPLACPCGALARPKADAAGVGRLPRSWIGRSYPWADLTDAPEAGTAVICPRCSR